MGTIQDKLNWLYGKKCELANNINTKYENKNSSTYLYPDDSLTSYYSNLNSMDRFRLIPVMTMYMPYCYGTNNSVTGYYPLKYYDTSYSWIDSIIDTSHSVYDPLDLYWTGGQSPNLTREKEGVIIGTMPLHMYSDIAVINIPFVQALGHWQHANNYTEWRKYPIYAGITYYYPDNRRIKVLTADDSTKNDSMFVLGNITLVDPYAYPYVKEDAMVLIVSKSIAINRNSSSVNSYNEYGSVSWSYVSGLSNVIDITINYGYNHFNYIWPIVTGEIFNDNNKTPVMAAIKKVTVNATTTLIEVALGRRYSMLKAGSIKLNVFARK